ncbi:TPA: Arc family DNA-binding protein [Salmonella enterica subsp. enterica serovar Singapore]|nr:Arc family DNA-binding protein [Salmonella enterica subsp. enterica serovar Singapore]
MARTDPVFNLRMPLDMKDELAERAKRNGRSLNAEILQILEDSIAAEKTCFPAGDARELRRVIQMQNELIDGQKEMVSKLTETFSLAISKISNLSEQEREIEKATENKNPT